MVVVQKIKKSYSQMDLAIAYYSMISVLNNLNLTQRELQLLAFTAIRGSITNPAARQDFCQLFNTSRPTINNIISKLRKLKLFVKEQNKIKVNAAIGLDFSASSFILQIALQREDNEKR